MQSWLLPVFAGIGFVTAQAATPDVAEISRRVVERDEQIQKALTGYEYDQNVRVDKLDATGQVTGSRVIDMIIRPGDQAGFTIVRNKNGDATVIPSETETRKMEKQAKDSEQSKAAFSLRQLASRYDVTLQGEDTLHGEPAYVLRFTPKPGQPYHDRVEKILNQLTGRMWVSRRDYAILQTEAVLSEPVQLAWFFATMETMTFHYETQPTAVGFAPAVFNLGFYVAVPMTAVRQRQTITMRNYRVRTVEKTAAKP